MSYLYAKWNSSECGSVVTLPSLEHCLSSPTTPGTEACDARFGRSEGVVSDRVGNSRPNSILANATFAVCITSDFWTAVEALKRN
jgi:hypothetical protein